MRIAGGIVALVAGVIALLITLAPVVFEETSSTDESLETLIFKAPPCANISDLSLLGDPDFISRCKNTTVLTTPQFGGLTTQDNLISNVEDVLLAIDFLVHGDDLVIDNDRQWILWASLIISGLVVLLGATALGSNSLAPAWLLPIIAIVGAPFAIVPVALLMPLVFIGGLFVLAGTQGSIKGTVPCLILLFGIGLPFGLAFIIAFVVILGA